MRSQRSGEDVEVCENGSECVASVSEELLGCYGAITDEACVVEYCGLAYCNEVFEEVLRCVSESRIWDRVKLGSEAEFVTC